MAADQENAPPADIVIRTLDSQFPVSNLQELSALVPAWDETLRNRASLGRTPSLRAELASRSVRDLAKLGVDLTTARAELVGAGLVEVCIPVGSPVAHLAKKLPWEFLLSSATAQFRSQPLLVLRHSCACKEKHWVYARDPVQQNLLVVKSVPGYLGFEYSMNSLNIEQSNVEANLSLTSTENLQNPSLEELRAAVAAKRHHIVHLSGVDSIQSEQIRQGSHRVDFTAIPEGMMFKGPNGLPMCLRSEDLAQILCTDSSKPSLICCNFSNSAGIAAATVENGCLAAIGFHHEIDDILAEVFFSNFYLSYRLSHRILDAFRLAWNELAKEQLSRLLGTGVVLWSRVSFLDDEREYRKENNVATSAAQPPPELLSKFRAERNTPASLQEHIDPLDVAIRPPEELNYSILHNNRNLFSWFHVRKIPPLGKLFSVSVEITLSAGTERVSFQARKDMDYTLWLLHDEIRLALTSSLARSVRESIYTSILVQVRLKGEIRFERTYRVRLLPIDQWQDDDKNRRWLPSFVLPRDPAIERIVSAAQKYLAVLADSPNAGFDSYESGNEGVDSQVGAIWWALTNDLPLCYVTPPPTFSSNAQRVRSPSDVLEAGRGTCIDLALLIAACLEYVDVSPVLFLLHGHAFVGYFRTEQAQEAVREWSLSAALGEDESWLFGDEFYDQILDLVQTGGLVPLEATGLTKRKGFWDGVEEGAANLRSKSSFEYLIDVKLARASGVTPLPLLDVRHSDGGLRGTNRG